MTLEQILDEWDKDSVIDRTKLQIESLEIPKLNSKYIRWYMNEKLRLLTLESELRVFRMEKFEFLTQGATKSTNEKGWKLPAKGIILNKEADAYLDVDKDVIDMTLRTAVQREKVEALKMILGVISNRSFHINSSIEVMKLQAGK